MYVMKVYTAGEYLFIKRYTPMNRVPLRQRIKRMRETTKAMIRYNNVRRSDKIQLLILNNFDRGYHITLDYPKGERPETYEEAEKNLTTALYKITRRLKREGKDFKYLAVTERGKKAAALHHHVIIQHDPQVLSEILRAWGQHVHISVMYEEGQYRNLAEYFVKVETKEEQTKGRSKYHRSRNLKEPQVRTALIDDTIGCGAYVPDGYRLMEGSFASGLNEVIGVRWQKYLLKKLPEPKETKAEPKKESKKTGPLMRLAKKIREAADEVRHIHQNRRKSRRTEKRKS